jgi:hypothetical protein
MENGKWKNSVRMLGVILNGRFGRAVKRNEFRAPQGVLWLEWPWLS